ASIRGTECSGGHFNLYDDRHAQDGREIVEWIGTRSWSNGAVGMVGGSFPGQTAYWVAASGPRPEHLKAVIPSLLHSDIYRDIFMPVGVQNILFPSLWTYGLGVVSGPHRVPYDSVRNGTIPNDEICVQAEASRYGVGDLFQPQLEPVWRGIEGVDNDWYHDHAALDVADNIKIPYYQQGNWQDEQVGPRAVVLVHHIHPDPVEICTDPQNPQNKVTVIPKKFALSSGDHGNGGFYNADRWKWFDIFLRGKCDVTGLLANPDSSDRPENAVVNYFETVDSSNYLTKKSGRAWPFPDTDWQQWYIHEGGLLDQDPPGAGEGQDVYLSGVPRRGWFWYEEY
ncbi:MAG: CocE/NonD family hydrolase, partial [bacterium]